MKQLVNQSVRFGLWFGRVIWLVVIVIFFPTTAQAFDGYNSRCDRIGCHSGKPKTCSGCHFHGISEPTEELTAQTDKDVYELNEIILVKVKTQNVASYTGVDDWVGVVLYDESGNELSRKSKRRLPVTIATFAKATGIHSLRASWLGVKDDEDESYSTQAPEQDNFDWNAYNWDEFEFGYRKRNQPDVRDIRDDLEHVEKIVATNIFTVVSAKLKVAIDINAEEQNIGGEIVYTITITNPNQEEATNVVLTDNLPDGVTFSSVVPTQGSCNESQLQVTCQLGSLFTGQSVEVTITTIARTAGSITNTARAVTDAGFSSNEIVLDATIIAGTSGKSGSKGGWLGGIGWPMLVILLPGLVLSVVRRYNRSGIIHRRKKLLDSCAGTGWLIR